MEDLLLRGSESHSQPEHFPLESRPWHKGGLAIFFSLLANYAPRGWQITMEKVVWPVADRVRTSRHPRDKQRRRGMRG